MATPFKVFRDNQKILLAIFGVLLMVAFVVMPPLVDSYRPAPPNADQGNQVVVVVGEEELTENEVMLITSKFDIVARVLGNAIQRAVALQGTPQPPMPPIPGLQVQPPSQQAPMQPVYNPVPPEVAVRFHVWAKKADELNLVVDDQTVRDFLRETAGGRLSDYDYNGLIELMRQENPGFGLNYDSFFEMVRDVLKAQKVQALFIRDGRVVTPTAAWVAYRNLNRTLSAELFPIKASDYLAEVGQPSEEQVRELFNKYRHQPNNPFQNQIGFRQMDKLALAYVKGDVNAFLEKAKQEVTDEQVAEHYEQNKDSYRKPQLPPAQSEPAQPESEQTEPAAEDNAQTPAAETPAAEMPAETPAAEPMTQLAAETMPESPAPMPEAPQSEAAPAADETPAVEETPAEPSEPESPEPEDSSLVAPRSTVRLVSFLQEEEAAQNGESAEQPAEPASAEEPADAPPAETPPTETPAEQPEPMQPMPEPPVPVTPMPEQPEGEAPATEAPATESPATESPATEAPATEAPAAEMPATEAPATDAPGEQPAQEEAPVEYRPLEEVADQIRTQLAQPIAQQKLTDALSEVRAALQFKYEEYRYSEAEKQQKSPYDTSEIQQMAEGLGLTYSTLPLMDIFTAAQTPLAEEAVHQVFVRDPGPQGFRQDTRQLIMEAFQSSTPLFQPRIFPGPTNDPSILHAFPPEVQYLYWKTETKEGFSPELDDVRTEVVEVWRKQEAAKRAREEAQKLASQINDAEALNKAAQEKKTEVIVAENVTYFNQFSAMNPQQGLSLGTIPGAEDISQETMEALFSAPVGKATAAPNRDKSVYYVAFVTEEAESAEQMREQFLTMIQGELPMSVQSYASQEENMVTGAILQDFFDPSQIEWKIDPIDLDSRS